MRSSSLVLFLIFLLGVLGKNRLVYLSCGIIMLLDFLDLFPKSVSSQNLMMDTGIVLLVIGVLLPLATGSISTKNLYESIFTFEGIVSFAVGVSCAVMAKNGVAIMKSYPGMTVGLLLGTIVGTSFFNGIPVGPLVAAGFAAAIVSVIKKIF
ncbi:MAG: DUF441 domain-containing protein [Thermoanaerobacterales bacterium]|nr:DUF441 domain-containing protein [Thermoanaerobacterales bacterium]